MADRQYPAVVYSKDGYAVVNSEADFKALSGSWGDDPVKKDDGTLVLEDISNRKTAPDLPLLGEGNTYEDRVNWQLQQAGITIDKRWSLETKLRKAQELQPLDADALAEANTAVPDDKKLDFDAAKTGKAAVVAKEVDAKVATALADKKQPASK